MSADKSCDCPCPDPVITEIPGVEGTTGVNGTNGAAGINAFTFTTAAFTVPAIGGEVTVLGGSSVWMAIGQNVFVLGAGTFQVTAKPGTTSATLTYLDYEGNTLTGSVIAAGATISPAGTQPALSFVLPNDLTDNSGGTASDTIAAGVGIFTLIIPITLVQITAAGDVLTTYTPGFAFKVLSVDARVSAAVTTVAKAATLNLEIGTTDLTGGAVALTSANCTPLGAVIAGSAVTAANVGTAADTISVEAATVTAFAEGAVLLMVRIQNMDTVNATASLAKHIDDLIVALT